MDPARWNRVKAVFQETFEREAHERPAVLDAACGDDAELREAVEQLLRAHAKEAGILDSPLTPEIDGSAPTEVGGIPPEGAHGQPPSRIGPYVVTRELGRGGMGTVYLAERDEPGMRKTVAVKVVRHGMDSAFVVRRFRRERQILAALEHPGIARLYDG